MRLLRQRASWFVCPAVAVLLAGPIPGLRAATVSGSVVAREGSRRPAVFRAEVIARESGSAEVAAVARTDREGRFLIPGLSSPKVVLSVRKVRYFTASVNGRDDENITLDCTVPADCNDVRFELGLGAVVSGMVRDEFGEPVLMAAVQANPPESTPPESGRPAGGRGPSSITDERGYFRLFGLRPGAYVLKAEGARRGPRSVRFQGEPVDIEVDEGREIHGVLITVRQPENRRILTVSGKITGLDAAGSDRGFVMAEFLSPESRWGGFGTGTAVNPDGSFTIGGLSPGRYAFSYRARTDRPFDDLHDLLPLGIVEVHGDLSGLSLEPLPPTGFSGVLRFESDGGPPETRVLARSSNRWRAISAVAKAPDYRFEWTNLTPGTYRLELRPGNRGLAAGRESDAYFVRGIRRGGELAPAGDITLSEGKLEQVELLISSEFSRVYGRVKEAPAGGPGAAIRKGAQFQVGLSGPGGFRVLQADQNGRFEFVKVIPGDYRICAWSDPDAQAIYDEKTWAAAGDAVRKFPVEAGSDVEIDLTAVP
jgi:hypothetical protein